MSKITDEAALAYKRFRELNGERVLPVVRVLFTDGRDLLLNGLAVAPTIADADAAVLSSPGVNQTTYVVRDADVQMIEIQSVE